MTASTRAKPLSKDERKTAILDAVIPLLLDRGNSVTSAQMAAACGVAEGTIFRVFEDKEEIFHEAIRVSLDPRSAVEEIEAIDPDSPFDDQLLQSALIIKARADKVHALASILMSIPHDSKRAQETRHLAIETSHHVTNAIVRLLEAAPVELSLPPERAAAAFRGLVHASVAPFASPDDSITLEEALKVFQRGVLS